jgi:sugar lactone lactonase YvrE
MGNATQIADVGEAADGPSWHASEGALYFTVPSSATPLRRLVPGGTASVVTLDASTVGTGSGGSDKIYLTESAAVVTVDVTDAGVVSGFTRTNGLGGTTFGDIATAGAGSTAWFVDTSPSAGRVYRFTPPSDLSLMAELGDAGRMTAIATRDAGGVLAVYVGAGGNKILVMNEIGGALDIDNTIATNGVPPNAIAVDDAGRIFVAWAKGIDIFSTSGTVSKPSDGEAMLPIGAIPVGLAFGGADRKTLFVTTSTGKIYSVAVQTAGVLR